MKKRKNRNKLDKREIVALLGDYSRMRNCDILKKYNISKGQLKRIRKDYGLKTKDVVRFYSKEEGKYECLLLIRDVIGHQKVFISDNIEKDEELLNSGKHPDKILQEDWGKYKFYTKESWATKEQILTQLDKFALYLPDNLVNDIPDVERSKLDRYLDYIIECKEGGKTYREIARLLPISVDGSTVYRFLTKR